MPSALVWFKRDLRTPDHAALRAAQRFADGGPVRCVYVIEPGLWQQPDASAQHWGFVRECLADLEAALSELGGELWVMAGEVTAVLARIHQVEPFLALFSHEETGNAYTYARDVAVGHWCRAHGIAWQERPQFGVVRRLRDRDLWHRHWHGFMNKAPLAVRPFAATPATAAVKPDASGLKQLVHLPAERWPSASQLGLAPEEPPARQRGGRREALAILDDFLHDRCGQYRGGISSPLSAPTACSRLSPYLAHGCLSIREVVQATQARLNDLEDEASLPWAARQRSGLSAFMSRLHWHCHFIQKLESEPELEWRNLHRGYDQLREPDFNARHFEALMQGRTGWPLVDACVAMLRHTGWLNFRMRAMLVSVAAYPLWLHWRPVGEWLARQFLDYEPGIHWSQLQMQSGTTGINTTRVYNPIKQARDHDPQGHFVRHWLPVMRRVPPEWLFEPWLMPETVQTRCGLRVGEDIPVPLVDLAVATRAAKTSVHALRVRPEIRAAVGEIVHKHGSRMHRDGTRSRATPRPVRREADTAAAASHGSPQLTLDF
ncbi:cryptochrome/deoxyribodipyrimidine photo-lyase family protein [Aquabacterium sp. NJ1]|uniref:cryptochrome/deoxyribodipyrimidine photo-lyase family protein n=1 Tax=Aquabacterium sp. NJ1 TaxID=1538295 RepID=UPI000689EDE1|nr:FAD-binding domain-containing protein [Aquabacterium sp. NJ1]